MPSVTGKIPDRPLRILTVVDLPWDPRLGAARVWIELSEEWARNGHTVEKFCLTDAYDERKVSPPRAMLRHVLFPYHAARFVRQNAGRFDIIDCLIGTLPFSKHRLRFAGLLVARSAGLYLLYAEFERWAARRWPDQPRGQWLSALFRRAVYRRLLRNSRMSVVHSDLLNLLNEDELNEIRRDPTISQRAIVQPNGLNARLRDAFARTAAPAQQRLQQKKVCFIGAWSVRKGARDWSEIISLIVRDEPGVEFWFLGTMTEERVVRRELGTAASERVHCISSYQPGELPQLLSDATVGLFPSYVEGFGLAVIEQLACGIPTIAYEVPGPRQILAPLREALLVPRGDIEMMARRAVQILRMNAVDYESLSTRCRNAVDRFRWERIAAETLEEYRAELENLGSRKAT